MTRATIWITTFLMKKMQVHSDRTLPAYQERGTETCWTSSGGRIQHVWVPCEVVLSGPIQCCSMLGYHEEPSCEGNLQKGPSFMLSITLMYVHTTGLSSCYFIKTILPTHLKHIGYNHKPIFTFEEVVNVCNDGRKKDEPQYHQDG